MKQLELLAPVGKLENAYAAIENGADAIFVGGKLFNARHSADNFDEEELATIAKYAKLRGVRVYVTVNTLIKQDELPSLVAYLKQLVEWGVDAIIVQDTAVVELVRKYFPTLTLHASTQMTAHSLEDVKALKEMGFKRVVLAREMHLDEIAYIKQHIDIEIETFVHGALCYSYSGQCLMSSLIGGRSGNRGRCAQSCRMQYSLLGDNNVLVDTIHMLSPKDICTLPLLPELIAAGIDSFKIEGRMKSPEYVATVVRNYRKYIDLALENNDTYEVDSVDVEEMQSIFNRGGFSKGYYVQKSGASMITEKTPKNIGLPIGKVVSYNPKTKRAVIQTKKELHPGDGLEIWNSKQHIGTGISKIYPADSTFEVLLKDRAEQDAPVYLSKNHQLLKTLRATYARPTKKIPVQMQVKGVMDEAIQLRLQYGEKSVTVVGEQVTLAENMPTTKEAVQKQLEKVGATSFEVVSMEVTWPENAFMAVSKLNELRRAGVEALEEAITQPNLVEVDASYDVPKLENIQQAVTYAARVNTLEQLHVCIADAHISRIYWEWNYNKELSETAMQLCLAAQKSFYLALPAIMKEAIWKDYKEALLAWEQMPIAGYLVRNYGQMSLLSESQKEKVIDYTLNVFNAEAILQWIGQGASRITPSLELSKKELLAMGGPLEKLIYGYYPVMTTEQCLLGNYKHCHKGKAKCKTYEISDRKDVSWPIVTDCEACKMFVLSPSPLCIMGAKKELSNIVFYRLDFTIETGKQVKEVLDGIFNNQQVSYASHIGCYHKEIQ